MDSITITRPVIVKVRVTDSYKQAAAAEVREALAGIEARQDQLDFQHARLAEMEKKIPRSTAGGLQQVEEDRRKVAEARRQLTDRLREIGGLAEGREVVHGRVESLVEIRPGDDWGRLMSVEVVLQDGRVVEIRQGGLP